MVALIRPYIYIYNVYGRSVAPMYTDLGTHRKGIHSDRISVRPSNLRL